MERLPKASLRSLLTDALQLSILLARADPAVPAEFFSSLFERFVATKEMKMMDAHCKRMVAVSSPGDGASMGYSFPCESEADS